MEMNRDLQPQPLHTCLRESPSDPSNRGITLQWPIIARIIAIIAWILASISGIFQRWQYCNPAPDPPSSLGFRDSTRGTWPLSTTLQIHGSKLENWAFLLTNLDCVLGNDRVLAWWILLFKLLCKKNPIWLSSRFWYVGAYLRLLVLPPSPPLLITYNCADLRCVSCFHHTFAICVSSGPCFSDGGENVVLRLNIILLGEIAAFN